MKYLIYGNLGDVKNRSEQIAQNIGCNGNVTKYWFGWIQSYSDQSFYAMEVPENQINLLNNSEISLLQDEEFMNSNGWFPPPLP